MSSSAKPAQQTQPADTDADLAAALLSSKEHSQPEQTNTNADTNHPNQASVRGMSHTGAWKPALDRRQSWNAQEYKHDLQSRQYIAGGNGRSGEVGAKKGGFSEV